MKANQKQLLFTAMIALAVSAAVVWASNNVDAVNNVLGD